MLLLSDTGGTYAQIAAKAGVSERTAYRYVGLLKESGFDIVKNKGTLTLEQVPELFARMADNVGVTSKEWRLMAEALDMVDDPLKEGLIKKVEARMSKHPHHHPVIRQRESRNIHELFRAMEGKKQVMLCRYNSSNSKTVADRLVEPIAFRNHDRSVDCFEISSRQVKNFKIARIEQVTVCPESWQYEHLHKAPDYDIFGMSSDTLIPVRLRLSMRAANLLKEEFPGSEKMLRPDGKEHFLLETEVRDTKGIGRFMLGLHNEMEIVDTPELENFLHIHARQLAERYIQRQKKASGKGCLNR